MCNESLQMEIIGFPFWITKRYSVNRLAQERGINVGEALKRLMEILDRLGGGLLQSAEPKQVLLLRDVESNYCYSLEIRTENIVIDGISTGKKNALRFTGSQTAFVVRDGYLYREGLKKPIEID